MKFHGNLALKDWMIMSEKGKLHLLIELRAVDIFIAKYEISTGWHFFRRPKGNRKEKSEKWLRCLRIISLKPSNKVFVTTIELPSKRLLYN